MASRAGGIGGLVAVSDAGQHLRFTVFDGNCNVVALVKADDGTVSANFEYGPFGETLRTTGTDAKENLIRFSTKYQDTETDLLYYGFRYYSSSFGTWLSRDPKGEDGGKHLYAFVRNSGLNYVDPLGLEPSALALGSKVLSHFFFGGGSDLILNDDNSVGVIRP